MASLPAPLPPCPLPFDVHATAAYAVGRLLNRLDWEIEGALLLRHDEDIEAVRRTLRQDLMTETLKMAPSAEVGRRLGIAVENCWQGFDSTRRGLPYQEAMQDLWFELEGDWMSSVDMDSLSEALESLLTNVDGFVRYPAWMLRSDIVRGCGDSPILLELMDLGGWLDQGVRSRPQTGLARRIRSRPGPVRESNGRRGAKPGRTVSGFGQEGFEASLPGGQSPDEAAESEAFNAGTIEVRQTYRVELRAIAPGELPLPPGWLDQLKIHLRRAGLPDDLPTHLAATLETQPPEDLATRIGLIEEIDALARERIAARYSPSAIETTELVDTGEEAPKPGYLGLQLFEKDRVLKRVGFTEAVEFGGNEIQWELMKFLVQGKGRRRSTADLEDAIWRSRNADVEKNTIVDAVSAVRQRIKILGLAIQNQRNLGYTLIVSTAVANAHVLPRHE